MEFVAASLAGAAIFCLAYTLTTANRGALALLERLNRHQRAIDPERTAILAQPFSTRAVQPIARRLRGALTALLPGTLVTTAERWLVLAGEPVALQTFLVFQAGAFAAAVLSALAIIAQPLSLLLTLAGVGACAVGGIIPSLWLRQRIRRRQAAILKELPDVVDLVVTSVEAGLAIDGALAEVARDVAGPLGEELQIAVRETALGRSRRDALLGVIDRTEVPELRSFIHSLIQAEQTGIPIGQVLRSQAAHVRLQRRQRAEAQAQRAPVKMVVVLVVLVLPAMLITIVGSALLRMAERL